MLVSEFKIAQALTFFGARLDFQSKNSEMVDLQRIGHSKVPTLLHNAPHWVDTSSRTSVSQTRYIAAQVFYVSSLRDQDHTPKQHP